MNKETLEIFTELMLKDKRDLVCTLMERAMENIDLENQLEEKDKIIDDTLKKTDHVYNMLNKYKENHIICFDKDLWGLYKRMDKELAEILERGKNANE